MSSFRRYDITVVAEGVRNSARGTEEGIVPVIAAVGNRDPR